ncbi:LOW QUALITY PROTEIN: aspartyl protease family protein At5g10770-like [Durio zibethinus]|uniref:LOW QUALITY PROTEIN: aspartyl protease family protein At5g10770-like n=1 Tax=Durio zibethinus TaxID=66656 RepID=A0A6P5WG94_DURZI|nr:LOW QUALITY PROTEIN: aspartyl protease family protein At5g10770-like [Durio zibethinus]
MAFVWLLVFCLSLAVGVEPLLAELQGSKLEVNQSGIHLKVYHVQGPESSLTPNFLSFSDFLLRDEERVKDLNSILAKSIDRSGSSSTASALSQRSGYWFSGKSLSIPLNPGLSIGTANYYVRIGIGTPANYYAMLMDTGSSFSWIQCEPCAIDCHSQADPLFNPSASKTYKSLSCDAPECSSLKEATLNNPSCSASNKCIYEASYSDKSYSIGFLSKDLLTLAQSQTFPNFVYGCGQDNEGLFGRSAGILGLAPSKLSMLALVSSKYGYAFSYCLPTTDTTTGGFLTIGIRPVSSYKFTPMIRGPNQNPNLYHLRLTSIIVAGIPLRVAAAQYRVPTIIDSGTVITRLPPSLYSALRDAFVNIMSKKYAQAPGYSIFDACFRGTVKSFSVVPEIQMMFQGGADLTLGASNVLIQVDEGVACLAFELNQEAIIGNHQQQTFEVAYDVSNSRIGFAANACH